MLMNYHEMTMGEPADSPQKKKQFTLITAIMAGCFSYAIMTSGVLLSVEPTEGIFPGGFYCYKLARRDYAASLGLGRRIMADLIGESAKKAERQVVEETLFHVYLDDPNTMGGRRQRWASGILVGESKQDQIDKLRSLNQPEKGAVKRYPTEKEVLQMSAQDMLEMLPYEVTDLPSVDSLVLQFPHTHGFISSLVFSFKVIPTMRRMAVEKGGEGTVPLVITQCKKEDEMCTVFAPLVQTQDFLLGQEDSEAYLSKLPEEKFLDWEGFKQGGRKVFPFFSEYIDMLP
eukprot:Nitzschia sp. Nitz4//scaffold99_size76975//25144//26087//NITZ4_005571-RA/size76975-snap-gene-0.5-mRNA-1//-1//CDS//3329560835//8257//frame0